MGTDSPPPIGVPIESVFDRMAPRMRRYFRFKGFGDEAEDMVQECFRRIIGRRADSPEAYLMRTAANVAIEQWRSRSWHHRDRHVSTDGLDLSGPDPLAQLVYRLASGRWTQERPSDDKDIAETVFGKWITTIKR